MKTFTLRLTDLESEALERLAAVYKVSQNQFIKDKITEYYLGIDNHARSIDGELEQIASIDSFPLAVEEATPAAIADGSNGGYDEDLYLILRAAKYAKGKCITEKEREAIEVVEERTKELLI